MLFVEKSNKALDLLRILTKDIDIQFEKARIEGRGTPQEVAERNEEAVKNLFLRKFFPFPYRVVKGNIIDSFGLQSASIDAIMLNPIHPYTLDQNNNASLILADGVDFVVEIKQSLQSEEEIDRALDQVRSVKRLKRTASHLIHGRTNVDREEKCKHIPVVLFASTTYSNIDHLIVHIANYYISKLVPLIEQFDLIVINGRVIISNIHKYSYYALGTERNISAWFLEEDTLALLLFLLNKEPGAAPLIVNPVINHYLDPSNLILNKRYKHYAPLVKAIDEAIENNTIIKK